MTSEFSTISYQANISERLSLKLYILHKGKQPKSLCVDRKEELEGGYGCRELHLRFQIGRISLSARGWGHIFEDGGEAYEFGTVLGLRNR